MAQMERSRNSLFSSFSLFPSPEKGWERREKEAAVGPVAAAKEGRWLSRVMETK
jgi:hypothetical protein